MSVYRLKKLASYFMCPRFLCSIIFLLIFCISVSSYALPSEIYILRLDDATINPITAEYIISAVNLAQDEGAQCLVIEMDTPGGLLQSTRRIVKKMLSSRVPVIVYIYPSGSRAGSAGVFVTYASNIAVMAPSTNIGAAHPVQLGGSNPKERRSILDAVRDAVGRSKKGTMKQSPQIKDSHATEQERKGDIPNADDENPMASKILNDTVAFIKSIASKRHRNVKWAIKAVTESASITAKEALQEGVINFIATDESDLFRKLDGMVINVGGKDITLATKDAAVRRVNMNFRERFLNVLANPNIAYFLLILGFYGLLYEVTHPGIGVPGVVGAVFLILAFFSMQTLPTNYAGLALIFLAIVLFIAEANTPGLGLMALGGVICMILGSIILFDSPDPAMRLSLSVVLPLTLATAAIAVFLVRLVIRLHKRKALSGPEGLVGIVGEAKSRIRANGEGKVYVHGEIWNATANSDIKKGDKITVDKVEGMMLTVRKINNVIERS